MPHLKKQLKITKLFRKGATNKHPEGCDELQEEVQKLEQKLQEKQNELFQIQRNNCRKKASFPKSKETPFVKPQKIVLTSSVETLKRNLELMSMLTGVEVQSYVADDHCCVVFHMQHEASSIVKHGLRIDMHSDGNEISKSTMPLGFNLKAVVEEFDKITRPRCLGAIRRALVAYYDRLQQYEALKELVRTEADLFKLLDGSHIEISFSAQSHEEEEDEHIQVTLMLDYRVYDIRPKTYCFKENELPEGVSEVLRQQCSVFKMKPLRKAFKEAFMNDVGPYRLVRQFGLRREEQQQKRPKRFRPNKNNYNNDDTFLPEDCTDQSYAEHYSE
ncbi:uncharacterized protein LOC120637802 isoform X1 [Pararge aegeria]|uniref:uncharacterized protein LOC120637802 isoform X1 n=1 Tax=Pararge aegeria TaxID=116150 RepID=UPI0019D0FCEA|nr:uncharacterized protein LOC120637802 isoform X1 [Pararge aegeria]